MHLYAASLFARQSKLKLRWYPADKLAPRQAHSKETYTAAAVGPTAPDSSPGCVVGQARRLRVHSMYVARETPELIKRFSSPQS